MAQVYAVMHDGKGEFMIAFKNTLGYFFHKAGGGGTIIPDGTPLNGAAEWALPGGRLEVGDPVQGALNEFFEETGVGLDPKMAYPGYLRGRGYYGVYFNAGSNFSPLVSSAHLNLEQAQKAANAVKAGTYGIGQYNELMDEYTGSPQDNELSEVYPWNLKEQINEINMLGENPVTDWYFGILSNLALETYGVIVTDPNNLLAGIGNSCAVQVGNQYVITDFVGSERLLQQGYYTIITKRTTYRHVTLVSNINNEGIFEGQ